MSKEASINTCPKCGGQLESNPRYGNLLVKHYCIGAMTTTPRVAEDNN